MAGTLALGMSDLERTGMFQTLKLVWLLGELRVAMRRDAPSTPPDVRSKSMNDGLTPCRAPLLAGGTPQDPRGPPRRARRRTNVRLGVESTPRLVGVGADQRRRVNLVDGARRRRTTRGRRSLGAVVELLAGDPSSLMDDLIGSRVAPRALRCLVAPHRTTPDDRQSGGKGENQRSMVRPQRIAARPDQRRGDCEGVAEKH